MTYNALSRYRQAKQRFAEQFDRPTPQDYDVTERASILPLAQYGNGQTGLAWPGMVTGIADAFTAPARAYRGEIPQEDMIGEGLNFAGNMAIGGAAAPRPAPIKRGTTYSATTGDLLYANGKQSALPGTMIAEAGDNALSRPGIRAYHGSPHDFDKFDLSKIGTGEGAQAFGHGLYFAENEGVAGAYKKQLTDRTNFIRPDGSMWTADGLEHMNVRAIARRGDLDAAIVKARELAATDSPVAGHAKRDLETLTQLQETGGIRPNPGRLYEVSINADPEDFLDWDKPLSQQSEKVRGKYLEALRSLGNPKPEKILESSFASSGEGLETMLQAWSKYDRPKATQALRDQGIPGIKYLDQGSRSQGEGSRNYVVFDDKLVEILRKYGLLGTLGGGAAALGMGSQPSEATPITNALARK
jgi:hypothetical protein